MQLLAEPATCLPQVGITYEGEVEGHDGVCLAWLWRAANKQSSRREGTVLSSESRVASKLQDHRLSLSLLLYICLLRLPLYRSNRFFNSQKLAKKVQKKKQKTNRTSYHVTYVM